MCLPGVLRGKTVTCLWERCKALQPWKCHRTEHLILLRWPFSGVMCYHQVMEISVTCNRFHSLWRPASCEGSVSSCLIQQFLSCFLQHLLFCKVFMSIKLSSSLKTNEWKLLLNYETSHKPLVLYMVIFLRVAIFASF